MQTPRTVSILLVILTIVLFQIDGFPQQNTDSLANQSGAVDTTKKSGSHGENDLSDTGKRGFNTDTIKGLIGTAGIIGYFLGFVLVLGVLFIFQQWFVLFREKKDALKIPTSDIRTMSYDDISKMFKQMNEDEAFSIDAETEEKKELPLLKKLFRKKKASAYTLVHKLFVIFENKKSTNSFNEETANYVQYLKDVFNPFLTRLYFLSDTAGALGLLGTVWGMFLVFYRGNPTPEETIHGMGIALATTIIGLVISIFLNSLTTIISNMFDKHLDVINKIATVFQERLMTEEELQPVTAQQIVLDSTALADMPRAKIPSRKKEMVEEMQDDAPAQTIKKEVYGPPSEIKIISGDNQTSEVNTKLLEPIIVEVADSKGHPLESQPVIFTAEDGAGMFSNDNRVQKVLTDEEGRAQATLTLGKKAGEKTIQIELEGNSSQGVKLLAIAKQTPPTKFVEIDGNYQTGELGKRMNKPFIVAIRDKYDNPIPRFEINFTIKKGSGKFQNSQNAHLTTYTNEDGLVEEFFIMGNDRGSRTIEVEAKRVEPSKIEFEVFAV